MRYRFYVTRDGVPLRLWMLGTNLYTGDWVAGWVSLLSWGQIALPPDPSGSHAVAVLAEQVASWSSG